MISHLGDIKLNLKNAVLSNNDRSLIILVFLLGFFSGVLVYTLWNIMKRKLKLVRKIQRRISVNTECKMVFCVRADLKMGKGKMCSQCCHACLAVYKKVLKRNEKDNISNNNKKENMSYLNIWRRGGEKKVVLKVSSENDLYEIEKKAAKENLLTAIIIDAGRTQIEPNTATVLAIEPAPEDIIDRVTGHLSLL